MHSLYLTTGIKDMSMSLDMDRTLSIAVDVSMAMTVTTTATKTIGHDNHSRQFHIVGLN